MTMNAVRPSPLMPALLTGSTLCPLPAAALQPQAAFPFTLPGTCAAPEPASLRPVRGAELITVMGELEINTAGDLAEFCAGVLTLPDEVLPFDDATLDLQGREIHLLRSGLCAQTWARAAGPDPRAELALSLALGLLEHHPDAWMRQALTLGGAQTGTPAALRHVLEEALCSVTVDAAPAQRLGTLWRAPTHSVLARSGEVHPELVVVSAQHLLHWTVYGPVSVSAISQALSAQLRACPDAAALIGALRGELGALTDAGVQIGASPLRRARLHGTHRLAAARLSAW